MIFGNLSGLVNGTEQVVFDSEVTGSAVSSISTGNILNGDEDGWYTIIARFVVVTDATFTMRINGDTGANYGLRLISGAGNTAGPTFRNSGRTSMRIAEGNSGNNGFAIFRLYAKSGTIRLAQGITNDYITGTTCGEILTVGQVWNNTTDNITSLSFLTVGTNIGVGTRVIILKSYNFTNGTPTGIISTPYIKSSWVRVASQVLGAPASSVTFSGLDGDRDVLYNLSMSALMASGQSVILRPNNDNTSGRYGRQTLYGLDTSVLALRETSKDGYYASFPESNGNYNLINFLLFAKSGFIRPGVSQTVGGISGTTIDDIICMGHSMNETSTNITSLVASISGGGNFDTGSQFDLYALRPNG